MLSPYVRSQLCRPSLARYDVVQSMADKIQYHISGHMLCPQIKGGAHVCLNALDANFMRVCRIVCMM